MFGRSEFVDTADRINCDIACSNTEFHEFVLNLVAAVFSKFLVVFAGSSGVVAGTSQVDLVVVCFGSFGKFLEVLDISAVSKLIRISVEEDGERSALDVFARIVDDFRTLVFKFLDSGLESFDLAEVRAAVGSFWAVNFWAVDFWATFDEVEVTATEVAGEAEAT